MPNLDVCVQIGEWVGACVHLLGCVLAISVHTWTAAKNEVFQGLSFKPTGFLVIDLMLETELDGLA